MASARHRLIRRRILTGLAVLYGALLAWHFPWATDDPVRREDELKAFYEMAYTEGGSESIDRSGGKRGEGKWKLNVPAHIARFVDRHHLQQAKVLDIGSGTGYLQDAVADYTGMDISSSAKRHYHKPFVAGTATAMPFEDDAFDAAWSIFVLEHIPNPEAALAEMRRVIKPGGLLYLWPGYNVQPWFAEGYAVRPYTDFDLGGKLYKATIPVRSHVAFWLWTVVPTRIIRSVATLAGPTRLHYRRMEPNYTDWWQSDSDAVSGLDSHEIVQWFTSRGDDCLNCAAWPGSYLAPPEPLELRIRE